MDQGWPAVGKGISGTSKPVSYTHLYAISESLEVDFVLETVQLLVKHHGISLSKETVIHSDQGTCLLYTSRCV